MRDDKTIILGVASFGIAFAVVMGGIMVVIVATGKKPKTSSSVTSAPAPAIRLKASGKTGLLGVPLPGGAVLDHSVPGDSEIGAVEYYAIDATPEQLNAFFTEAMPKAGWTQHENKRLLLSYKKGKHFLLIFLRDTGGYFSLQE